MDFMKYMPKFIQAKKANSGVVQGVMMSLIFVGVAGLIVAILIAIIGQMSQTAGLPIAATNALTNTTLALATFPNNWLSLMVLGICAGALITIVVVGILGIFGKGKQ
jgi:hypothetical protein